MTSPMHPVLILLTVTVTLKTALSMGGADDMNALHKFLFANYSAAVRPSRNYSRPTEIGMSLFITTVIGLDTKKQLLHIQGVLYLDWHDELLQWDPNDYGGISDMLVPQDMIWRPDIVWYNVSARDLVIGSDLKLFALVTSQGVVEWTPSVNIKIQCQLDISKFPFDVHECRLTICTWMSTNWTVQLKLRENPVNLEHMVKNGEFDVTAGNAYSQTENILEKYYYFVYLQLKLARRPIYIVLSLIVPVTMLGILGCVSFLLAPDVPEKVTVSVTILLSFTVFLTVIDNSIPQTADHISLLLVYVTALLALSFLGVIGNIFIIAISTRDKNVEKTKRGNGSSCHGNTTEHNMKAVSLQGLNTRFSHCQAEDFTNDPHDDMLQTNQSEARFHEFSGCQDKLPVTTGRHRRIYCDKRDGNDDSGSVLNHSPARFYGLDFHVKHPVIGTRTWGHRLNKIFLVLNALALFLIASTTLTLMQA